MRRIESNEDMLNGVVTYELSNGKRLRLSALAIRDAGGPGPIIRAAGYGNLLPTERVTVMWAGRKAGTVPPDFDPLAFKSKNWLYDPRPGDFTCDGDTWVASPKLGPGDLEAVPGFVWDREIAPSTSTPLS